MAAHTRCVREVYPDLQVTIEQQIAEGEWVVSLITARATPEGGWLGMKPTGRHLVFTAVNVDRVVADRMAEHGGAANMLIHAVSGRSRATASVGVSTSVPAAWRPGGPL